MFLLLKTNSALHFPGLLLVRGWGGCGGGLNWPAARTVKWLDEAILFVLFTGIHMSVWLSVEVRKQSETSISIISCICMSTALVFFRQCHRYNCTTCEPTTTKTTTATLGGSFLEHWRVQKAMVLLSNGRAALDEVSQLIANGRMGGYLGGLALYFPIARF